MNQPAYLSAVNIRCIGGCSQIVKSNGVPTMEHTVLHHKYSPGETAMICRKCRANFNRWEGLTGNGGNWKAGEFVTVQTETI